MDAKRRIVDADVLIDGGWIKRVGTLERRNVGTTKPTIVDCKGLIVLPGLIQAHIHLCQTLFRGLADDLSLESWLAQRIWPMEAAHTDESIYWSAMLGAAELLLGGTTAILDMETVRHTGSAFTALEEIGIRATAGKCLMDAPENPASLRETTDTALTESAELCARWHGAAGGRLRYCFAPRFAPSCTGPLLRAVSDLAERSGAVIHTHAAETPVELEIVKRATGWGLSGIEFGCAIPGTAGGAVRMNAGAYGGEMRDVLADALVIGPAGSRRGGPDELGMRYRRSDVAPGEVVAEAVLELRPDDPDRIRRTVSDMQRRRREAQPAKVRTFGSVWKNPDPERTAGRLLEECGLKGYAVGGARISPVHANFIENHDGARSADVIALMREARRRAGEHGVQLEHEVQMLGPIGLDI